MKRISTSGGSERFSEFIGLKFMVDGSGIVELDCQTGHGRRLCHGRPQGGGEVTGVARV